MPTDDPGKGMVLHCKERGAGRPLVLVHGWSMSGRIWEFQQGLGERFRLIIPDLRGHGASDAPADGYSLDDLAADLVSLFGRLDLDHAVLLGWSLGAQAVLAAYPAIRRRLSGIVLAGGTPRFTATEGYPCGVSPQELRGMGLRLKRDFTRTMGEFFRGMFAEGELSREQENRIAREIVMGGRLPVPEVAARTLDILASADLRDTLESVDLPVLLIHGSEDTICPVAAAHYMARKFLRVRLEIMEAMGHAPFLSHPDRFNRLVAGFIDGLERDD